MRGRLPVRGVGGRASTIASEAGRARAGACDLGDNRGRRVANSVGRRGGDGNTGPAAA